MHKNDKTHDYVHNQLLFTLKFVCSHMTSVVDPLYSNA